MSLEKHTRLPGWFGHRHLPSCRPPQLELQSTSLEINFFNETKLFCICELNVFCALRIIEGFVKSTHSTVARIDHKKVASLVASNGHSQGVQTDPALYAAVDREMGITSPAEVLFIDDNAANIASAAAYGWRTLHFI